MLSVLISSSCNGGTKQSVTYGGIPGGKHSYLLTGEMSQHLQAPVYKYIYPTCSKTKKDKWIGHILRRTAYSNR